VNMLTQEMIAWLQALSTLFAFLALLLSVVAVYFTVVTFRLKKGSFLRGQYIVSNSIATNDPYVCEVLLENLKDRSVVIFGIYLQLDNGYFLCLEEFEEDPLIISPFEVVRREYDPLDGYSFNTRRLKIDALLENRRRTKIMLSTTDGMIKVKKPVFVNKPVYQWFKNHFIITIGVDRTNIRGKSYGGATKYLVSLFNDDELIQAIQLYGHDHNYKWFRDLGGEASDLTSSETVQKLFERVILEKKSKANRVEVIDYQEALRKRYEDYDLEPWVAERRSWIFVYVVGRLLTIWDTRRLRRENKARQKQNSSKNSQIVTSEQAEGAEADNANHK